MIELIDFSNCPESNRDYGGNSGLKLGILIGGIPWMLKFPKSLAGFRNVEMSYSTSPLSEYLGSKVYEAVGIPVHETRLGVYNGKVVVACKDILSDGSRLQEFRELKNRYSPELEAYLSSSQASGQYGMSLETVEMMFSLNPALRNVEGLEEHFWDMFVVDSLIGNNDRNNGNWGIISDGTRTIVSPVYDNGNAFRNKASDNQLKKTLLNEEAMLDSAYRIQACFFEDERGQKINPDKYIAEMKNEKCTAAVMRIVPRINLNKLREIIWEIPDSWNGRKIISGTMKEYCYRVMEIRCNKILFPVFEKTMGIGKNDGIDKQSNEQLFEQPKKRKGKVR